MYHTHWHCIQALSIYISFMRISAKAATWVILADMHSLDILALDLSARATNRNTVPIQLLSSFSDIRARW